MATLTASWGSVDNVGSWGAVNNIKTDDTNYAYKNFSSAGTLSYVKLYNWDGRSSIQDGATINSVLVSIRGFHATGKDPGSWGINFDDTDLSADRQYSNATNETTATTLTIPTTGSGQTPNWWRSGWASADILAVIKKTSSSGAMRFYAVGNASTATDLRVEYITMTVDYTNPPPDPTYGGVLLGNFG